MCRNQRHPMERYLLRILFLVTISLLGASLVYAAGRPKRVKPEPPQVPVVSMPTILSIIPAQGEPGDKVTIFGSGFGDKASAFLGSVEIPAKVSDGRQLEFIIPSLDPGLYALYLKREDGITGRTYNFTILPLRPELNELSPDHITSCAQGRDREINAMGKNFSGTSLLLLDGAAIRSRFISSDNIAFTVPQVSGGLHQVAVRNGPDNVSVTMGLTIETKPEISQVTIGDEYVNYYELIIDGKNFEQNSALYVDGQRIGGRGGQDVAEREKLVYVDCTRLVYQRYPYSPVNKDFRIQVINPGGEGSQLVNVTAP